MKFAVTKLAIRGLSCVAGVALTFLSLPAQGTNINVTITVDNSYALFYGTHTLATNFVGGDGNWPTRKPMPSIYRLASTSMWSLPRTSPPPRGSSDNFEISTWGTHSTVTIHNGRSRLPGCAIRICRILEHPTQEVQGIWTC